MTFKKIDVVIPKSQEDMERLRALEEAGKLATDRDYPDGKKTEDSDDVPAEQEDDG